LEQNLLYFIYKVDNSLTTFDKVLSYFLWKVNSRHDYKFEDQLTLCYFIEY